MRIEAKLLLLIALAALVALLPVASFGLALWRLEADLEELGHAESPWRIQFKGLSYQYLKGTVQLEFWEGSESLGTAHLNIQSGPLYKNDGSLQFGLAKFEFDLHQQPGRLGGKINEYAVWRVQGTVPLLSAPRYHATSSDFLTSEGLRFTGIDLRWNMAHESGWEGQLQIEEVESVEASQQWQLKQLKAQKQPGQVASWSALDAKWMGSLLELRAFKLQGSLDLRGSDIAAVFKPLERFSMTVEDLNGSLGLRALLGKNLRLQLSNAEVQQLDLNLPQVHETLGDEIALKLQLRSPHLLQSIASVRQFLLAHQQAQESVFDFSFSTLEKVDLEGKLQLSETSSNKAQPNMSTAGFVLQGHYRLADWKLRAEVPSAGCLGLNEEIVGLFSWPQREDFIAQSFLALQREGLILKTPQGCVLQLQKSPGSSLNWNDIAEPIVALERYEASLSPPPALSIYYERLASEGALSQPWVLSGLVQQAPGSDCVQRNWPALCLEDESAFKESFDVSWEITPQGKAENVSARSANRTPQALLSCIISEFSVLHFKTAPGRSRAEVQVRLKPAKLFHQVQANQGGL